MPEAVPPAFHEDFIATLRDSRGWDHFSSTIQHYLDTVGNAGANAVEIPETVFARVADIVYGNARASAS